MGPPKPRAAGQRTGCRLRRCARYTNCSSPARSTPATLTQPHFAAWWLKVGSAASPRAWTRIAAAPSIRHRRQRRADADQPSVDRRVACHSSPSGAGRHRRRRGRRRDRCRRHPAVGGGRPQSLPQGRGDELRPRRRLERERRRDQRAGHRAGAGPRTADPWLGALLPHRAAVELHCGARTRPRHRVLLGAIDLTGGAQVVSPQTLGLVRATAVAVENQLALLRVTRPPHRHRPGRGMPDGPRRRSPAMAVRTIRQLQHHTHRQARGHPGAAHRHPEGLSADHLAMLLDEKDLDVVTIRAEMSRLRRVIGPQYIASRPYRLFAPIDSDLGDVFDALKAATSPLRWPATPGNCCRSRVAGGRPVAHRVERQPARRCADRDGCAAESLARYFPKGVTIATAGECCTTA